MIRFFVSPEDVSGGLIRLGTEDAAHIRSLRMRPNELFIVCDGEGSDYVCRLAELGASEPGHREQAMDPGDSRSYSDGRRTAARIVEMRRSLGEPSVACSVFIALAKGERLDYAVQKSVELGASDVVLFPSARCVALPGDASKKTERLSRIALETAKQCGRGRIPAVSSVGSFEAAIRQAASGCQYVQNSGSADYGCGSCLSLFFYEEEQELHLKQVLERRGAFGAVSIVTGPEGGFEPGEAQFARSAGLTAVSLGTRILRCETAPVAALAAIMFYTGNM